MKKICIAAICAAVMSFSGCISNGSENERSDCYDKPAVQASAQSGQHSQFADEQYVWETWQYGTNRVNQAK